MPISSVFFFRPAVCATAAVYEKDDLLVAELDLSLVPQAQMDFDPVGHYARPDVFSLRVNTAPQDAVRLGDRNDG